jgi:hypothetical protein
VRDLVHIVENAKMEAAKAFEVRFDAGKIATAFEARSRNMIKEVGECFHHYILASALQGLPSCADLRITALLLVFFIPAQEAAASAAESVVRRL